MLNNALRHFLGCFSYMFVCRLTGFSHSDSCRGRPQTEGIGPLIENGNTNKEEMRLLAPFHKVFVNSSILTPLATTQLVSLTLKSKERVAVSPQQNYCCVNTFVFKQDSFSLLRVDVIISL